MSCQLRRVLVANIVGALASPALTACAPTNWVDDAPMPAACNDGERNGDETDVDCGGPSCKQCVIGNACRTSSDCASGDCTSGTCREQHCGNLTRDEDEEAVDCGGKDCRPCATNVTCTNGTQDDNETDVDCGGLSGCDRCGNGDRCTSDDDCLSKRCLGNVCSAHMIGAGGACAECRSDGESAPLM